MDFDQSIGAVIRQRRKQLGLTLSELAGKLEVSIPQMQKYETGVTKLSPKAIIDLSSALSIKPSYLFETIMHLDKLKDPKAGLIPEKKESPLKILIIDDDASDIYLTRSALKEANHPSEIYEIHDAETVIPCLRQKSFPKTFGFPEIIFLDLHMPKISGFDVLRTLKRDPALRQIPVIVLTNAISKNEMWRVYDHHASGYICKSFEMETYKQKLIKVIDYWSEAVAIPQGVLETTP